MPPPLQGIESGKPSHKRSAVPIHKRTAPSHHHAVGASPHPTDAHPKTVGGGALDAPAVPGWNRMHPWAHTQPQWIFTSVRWGQAPTLQTHCRRLSQNCRGRRPRRPGSTGLEPDTPVGTYATPMDFHIRRVGACPHRCRVSNPGNLSQKIRCSDPQTKRSLPSPYGGGKPPPYSTGGSLRSCRKGLLHPYSEPVPVVLLIIRKIQWYWL